MASSCLNQDFSELEEFADLPIRTYSTGMIARLAFATAVCVNPEILVLDEVFSVGDQTFSRKSFNRIKEFIKNDKTVFLCSHSAYHIQMVCNKTLYLKNKARLHQIAEKIMELKQKQTRITT